MYASLTLTDLFFLFVIGSGRKKVWSGSNTHTCRAQNNCLSSVIFRTKSHNDRPNQKWFDIMAYQNVALKCSVHPNCKVLPMTDQVECWSVILTDQAKDVILSTALNPLLPYSLMLIQKLSLPNDYVRIGPFSKLLASLVTKCDHLSKNPHAYRLKKSNLKIICEITHATGNIYQD